MDNMHLKLLFCMVTPRKNHTVISELKDKIKLISERIE